jgi:predicted RNA methylase
LIKTLQEWGYEARVAVEMGFDSPQMYQFHNQKTKDIEVDLRRVIINDDLAEAEDLDDNKYDGDA